MSCHLDERTVPFSDFSGIRLSGLHPCTVTSFELNGNVLNFLILPNRRTCAIF